MDFTLIICSDSRNLGMALTDLYRAAKQGNIDLITVCLNLRKVDVNKPNAGDNGKRAVHYAAEYGQANALRALVNNGADLTAKDATGRSVLLTALRTEPLARCDIVKYLCRHLPTEALEDADENGCTGLLLACRAGAISVATALLNAGARIDAEDKHGAGPLHLAARAGQLRMVNFLIERGADVLKQDKHGYAAYQYAFFKGHAEIATLLHVRALRVLESDPERKERYLRDVNVHMSPTASPGKVAIEHVSVTVSPKSRISTTMKKMRSPMPPHLVSPASTLGPHDAASSPYNKLPSPQLESPGQMKDSEEDSLKATAVKRGLYFTAYPATSNLYVQVRAVHGDVATAVGTFHCGVTLDTSAWPLGELHVTAFASTCQEAESSEELGLSAPLDYEGGMGAPDSHKPSRLELGSVTVSNDLEGIAPYFWDTKANMVELIVKHADAPLSDGILEAEFEPCAEGARIPIRRMLDSFGKVELLLPAGRIRGRFRRGRVSIPMNVLIPPRSPADPDTPSYVIRRKILSSCSFIMEMEEDIEGPVVILADRSGSMTPHIRQLHSTLLAMYEDAITANVDVAMGVWDHTITFCPGGYLAIADYEGVQEWISSIAATGGTEIRYAIQTAVRKFPDAKSLIIMTDGDIGSVTEWFRSFAAKHSKMHFHFVAFSRGADAEQLQILATLGRGMMTFSGL